MGVNIDKAGRHDLAVRVNFFATARVDFTNCGNQAAIDCDICSERCAAAAIDNHASANDQIMHFDSPRYSLWQQHITT